MKEVEIKILEIDKEQVIAKLEELGAIKMFEGTVCNDFFGNDSGKKIRLRKMGEDNILTYKEWIDEPGVKSQNEYEIKFDDYENIIHILQGIGFSLYGKSSKTRISYSLGNMHFDIDKLDGIPWFVEVESDNSSDVQKGVELLGFDFDNACLLTERGLKERYGIKIN
ncbi:MAG: class IV adenylate cyclase [Candidatus Gracilibacteria bacterium]|nr:class IV adenylate cyclase [Candidatus Gracilibacteria bacterium]